MADLEKEIKKDEKKIQKFLSKKENIWMSVSAVLVIALILVVVWPSGMSANAAGENLVNYLNTQVVADGGVVLKNVEAEGSLYKVNVIYNGQEIPVYTTKDGDYFIQGATPMEVSKTVGTGNAVSDTPKDVPKSDKPKVELYVWAYCPYGVQAQGPMADVAALLKGKVDFEIVPYYDGHGAYETQQNQIQMCIQDIASDKYWSYAKSFVANIYPKCGSTRDIACDKTESIALMKTLGIDSTKVMACVSSKGQEMSSEASAKAQANGVSGSPTIRINGVVVNVARNSEAIKTAVCSAFTNAPSECSESLSSTAAASSGSC